MNVNRERNKAVCRIPSWLRPGRRCADGFEAEAEELCDLRGRAADRPCR